MPIFGTMRPRLVAKTIMAAVAPSAIVALRSSNVVCEPSTSCRNPLAALNIGHHLHGDHHKRKSLVKIGEFTNRGAPRGGVGRAQHR